MKKLLSILILLLSIHSLQAQSDQYYWSDSRKIYVSKDDTRFLLRTKTSSDVKGLAFRLKGNPNISFITSIENNASFCLVKFRSEYKNATTGQIKALDSQIEESIPYYTFNGAADLIPTGEIIIQPKMGVSIETVIMSFGKKLEFQNATEYGYYKYKVTVGREVFDVANAIYEQGLVEISHPNFLMKIVRNQAPFFPNDPQFPQQYYLNQGNNIDINAPQAWGISRGIHRIRVAVIDDGVENHPDLQGRVLQGLTPMTPNNGFGAPINNPPNFTIGHGEACAGIIGATANNNLGVSGIANNVDIVPINIFSQWFTNANGDVEFIEDNFDIASGINWAWNQGQADVLSNSWNYTFNPAFPPGGFDLDIIRNAINNARTQGRGGRGSVVVWSSGNLHSGNGSFNGVNYPANTAGVITVGAVDQNGTVQGYSSRGAEMNLVAPVGNNNIQTTDRPGINGYDNGDFTNTFGGTSAACPQVAGGAALMLSVNPNLTENDVRNILNQTATDMGSSGFDNTYGFGRLNLEAALNNVVNNMVQSSVYILCGSGQFSIGNLPSGSTASWAITPSNLSSPSSGTGTSANFSINNGVGGSGQITFTINGVFGTLPVRKTFWVGAPEVTQMRLNGVPIQPYSSNNVCFYNLFNLSAIISGGGSSSWQLLNTTTNAYISSSTYNGATISAGGASGTFALKFTVTNSCGSQERIYPFNVLNCMSSYTVYPNPARDYLTIEFDNTDNLTALPETISLLSEASTIPVRIAKIKDLFDQKAFKDGTKVVFDVRELPRGIYYLHIADPRKEGQEVESIRILLD